MIYDGGMNLLSGVVTRLIPRLEPIKVESRLLDGSYHFQTIGEPGTVVDVEAMFSWASKDTLDAHAAGGEMVRVETAESYWVGVIRDVPAWELSRPGPVAQRLYRGAFTLAVAEQGALP